jgi:hypothetical protein
MKTVAVIGAGIFGLETAIQLQQQGYRVTIFERRAGILQEGTGNSVLRLHLGLHYPRDLETAIQSRRGYESFLNKFSDGVNLTFSNYYAIAKEGSKVSTTEFKAFAHAAKISIKAVSTDVLEDKGVETKLLDSAWECAEGVIDLNYLRDYFNAEINHLGINLITNCEIRSANRSGNSWEIFGESSRGTFNFIVRATYGLDRITSDSSSVENRAYEYHRTFALEIEFDAPSFGLTVIDGDFLTLLPKGFTSNFFVYGPTPSVLARYEGSNFPSQWNDRGIFDMKLAEEILLTRLHEWIPSFSGCRVVSHLNTVRSIQPNMSTTDKRVSNVQMTEHNFIDIWSGKIDHCIEIGNRVVGMLSKC